MTDSDLIRYTAEAIKVLGDAYAPGRLPPFPGSAGPTPATIAFQTLDVIVTGQVTRGVRPRHLTVAPGAIVSSTARGKRSVVADDLDPWAPAGGVMMQHHFPDPRAIMPGTPVTMQAGDAVVFATSSGGVLQEAVLVECGLYPDAPSLALWPRALFGATEADVVEFERLMDWCPETAEGWQGGAGHARLNCTPPMAEAGYGAKIAEKTSFGALLLVSDLPDALKLRVQTRLLLMSQDLELFNINYPANGGHGNGRLFPWLVRKIMGIASRLQAFGFSEVQQPIRYDGAGSFEGWGFRHYATSGPAMTENYWYCCTANRWAGAALAADLLGMLNDGNVAVSNWSAYTKAYLRKRLSMTGADDWFVMHGRSRELILANRQALGF